MEKKWKILLFVPVLMATMVISGCMGSNDDGEENIANRKTAGSVTVYQLDSSYLGNGLGVVTVVDGEMILDGIHVIVSDMNITYGHSSDEEDDSEIDYYSGTGLRYFREDNRQPVKEEMVWEYAYRSNESENWSIFRNVYDIDIVYHDEVPDHYEIGMTYTFETTKYSNIRKFVDGVLKSDENETLRTNTTYNILEEVELETPSGTFDCLKIRIDVEGEDSYEIKYYSPDLNEDIKATGFENGEPFFSEVMSSYTIV